jgi:hypothetical protein
MAEYFVLDGHTAVPSDLLTWAKFFEAGDNRAVASADFGGDAVVSTVFLGLNHAYLPDAPPLLFETMVFADAYPAIDQEQRRYTTWDEAMRGHRAIVAEIASVLGPPTFSTQKP